MIGRSPRRCIWFHPDQKRPTRIEWAPAQTGSDIVIDYGFTDKVITDHTRAKSRTQPAKLVVRGDDAQLGSQTIEPKPGWHRWVVSSKGKKRLSFEISTQSHVDAHFCFDVTLRAKPGGKE